MWVIRLMSLVLPLSILGAYLDQAEARPSTKSYTCQGLKELIAKRGAVILATKTQRTYNRFVANPGSCPRTSYFLKRVRVPTKSGQCSLRVCSDEDDRSGRE